jgi:hypothetical protein
MLINSISRAVLLLVWFSPIDKLLAQQAPCDIPVVATSFNSASRAVELVKDLGIQNFEIKLDGVPQELESASVDNGPKRVALILDASKNVPRDEWKLETQMAARLVEHARPPSEARERLRTLGSSRSAVPDSGEKVYDTLLAAAGGFNPPQFGDALFLFGHSEDSGSKADVDQLLEMILKNRLRFYGLSFTDPLQGKLPAGYNPNNPLPANVRIPRLVDVGMASGYNVYFHSVRVLNLPGQTALFEGFLGDLFRGVAEPYRVRIARPLTQGPMKLEITVKNIGPRRINLDDIHYPRSIYPCTMTSLAAQ